MLVNPIVRSATSIGANIHEANYASSKADFINKSYIALKECGETEYWIEMRLSKSIKSTVLELKGSSFATMSRKIACAVDNVMNVKGKLSMESSAVKEHGETLLFEIEF